MHWARILPNRQVYAQVKVIGRNRRPQAPGHGAHIAPHRQILAQMCFLELAHP